MKKIIPFLFVILLLTSCTTVHVSRDIQLVNRQLSNSLIQVDVAPNGITDSYASFIVSIKNGTNKGIYFFEDNISFWSGNRLVSKWDSERYIANVIDDSYNRFAIAAFFVDLFSLDSDDYDDDDDSAQEFFEFLSIANLIATGIDAASTIENSTNSLLKSVYIPAGETAYGFISCKIPMDKIVVNTNNSFNTFTFVY